MKGGDVTNIDVSSDFGDENGRLDHMNIMKYSYTVIEYLKNVEESIKNDE